jgi:hypothetical protein
VTDEPRGTYFEGAAGCYDRRIAIVGEGPDDAYLLDSILSLVDAPISEVGVGYSMGTAGLEQHLRELQRSSSYVRRTIRRVLIVRDADRDAGDALAQTHEALKACGLPEPAHGQFLRYDAVRELGLFIIPSGNEVGALETYLLDAVEGDERLGRSRALVTWVEETYGKLPKPHKRLMQMYLACVEVNCRGPGRAFRLGVFPKAHTRFDELKAFVRQAMA